PALGSPRPRGVRAPARPPLAEQGHRARRHPRHRRPGEPHHRRVALVAPAPARKRQELPCSGVTAVPRSPEGSATGGARAWRACLVCRQAPAGIRWRRTMAGADLLRLMRNLRAVGEYTDEPVAEQAIIDILEVGRWTGTGGNSQPADVVVIRDPEVR